MADSNTPQYSGTTGGSAVLSPQDIANRQLTGSTGTSASNAPTPPQVTPDLSALNAGNAQAAGSLSSYLGSGTLSPQESTYENGIMGRYNQANKNTTTQYQNMYGAISNDYSNQFDQLNRDLNTQMTGVQEARTGFATNTAILRNLQETGQNRIATLEKTRDQALLSNNADMVNSLNKNILDEQSLITTARQNYVANLSAAANLQTPEQKNAIAQQAAQQQAVVQLQQEAPDANISSSDTYDQAIAKFRSSKYYQNNIATAEATIANIQAQTKAGIAAAGASGASATASVAQAGLAGAQTSQTRQLTSLVSGASTPAPTTDPDVQALLLNQKDPTKGMTAQQLQDKYAGYPSGTGGPIAASKMAGAVAAGYTPAGASLSNESATNNARNLSSGGYTGAATATTNFFGNLLGNVFGSPSSLSTPSQSSRSLFSTAPGTLNGMVTMTGPKGTYSVPASSVATMQKNGYTISH